MAQQEQRKTLARALSAVDTHLVQLVRRIERLKSRGYDNLLPVSTDTNVRYSAGDASLASKSQSTMWLGGGVLRSYTGHSGVVREGLSNPWIPDGWSWGGVASSHCPMWAEFYTNDQPPDGDTAKTKSKKYMSVKRNSGQFI
ncbi:Endonuclease/exonuclease/phosphatase family domain-containing protein 1 [Lamellibrachia satsuma]|nr:Endonuclease/exonuclease/phosphatase family domain-containing protein 1 [Lamellibrachia satsuma]